ncbi:response regulator transcription factor [Devosia aquimaris]|uniref:response regulator transcription factor n=1 Tax=Devosia aquimaris TaxID=2866214 RepID=UPI001CD1053A
MPQQNPSIASTIDFNDRLRLENRITHREKQVLHFLYAGHTNKQIGKRLGISDRTIEVHRGNAMLKLQCKNVVELVRWMAGDPVDP